MLSAISSKSNKVLFLKNFTKNLLETNECVGTFKDDNIKKEKEILFQYERSKQKKVFIPMIPQLLNKQYEYQNKMYEYNNTKATEREKRNKILKEIFSETGHNCIVETPINSNWGCKHVHLGENVYINSNVTFVDDNEIRIGDNTLIGPNVCFTTAGHPILPSLRLKTYQYNFPIHIGKNVWIGSGVIILPGVKIGDNSVIGAGSVVSRDIPKNCVAYGTPCKVIREINQRDYKYYFRENKLDIWE